MGRVHHRQTILSGKYFSDTENRGRTSNKRHILHEGRPHRQAHRHILPPIGIYLRTKTYSCEKILPPAAPDKSLSNLVLSLGKRESTISTLSHRRYNRTKRTTGKRTAPKHFVNREYGIPNQPYGDQHNPDSRQKQTLSLSASQAGGTDDFPRINSQ